MPAPTKPSGTTATPEQPQTAGSITVDLAPDASDDNGFAAAIRGQLESAVSGIGIPESQPNSPAPAEEQTEGTEEETDQPSDEPLPESDDDEGNDDDEPGTETEPKPAAERPEWPHSAHRRVAKLSKKNKELTAELAQLKAQQTEQPTAPGADQTTPITTAPVSARHQDIARAIAEKEAYIRFADENPDGGTVTGRDGQEVSYTAEQVRRIHSGASVDLADLKAQLRELNRDVAAQAQGYLQEAVTAYPWLKDKTSPQFQLAAEVVRQMPGLRSVPDWPIWLADAIAGRAAREAKAKAPARSHKPQIVPTQRGAAPRRPAAQPAPAPTGPAAQAEEAKRRFYETGDREAARAFIEASVLA